MVPLACGIHYGDCLSGHRSQSTAAPWPHGKAGERPLAEESLPTFTNSQGDTPPVTWMMPREVPGIVRTIDCVPPPTKSLGRTVDRVGVATFWVFESASCIR
jgi:hypothetical protein